MRDVLMMDIAGLVLSETEQQLLQHPGVGAVLLFTRNFQDRLQLRALTAAIRQQRSNLLIAVDHEGGYVQRFQRQGYRAWPAARVYGEIFDLNASAGLALARKHGEEMARELQEDGIDLNMSPVLDVHDEQSPIIARLDRAFHRDPTILTELAAAFIEGMRTAGMPAIGKHFPGHGSVATDSHVEKPICNASAEQLRHKDLQPFSRLIAEGLLPAVMPAHVVYPAFDGALPAGFSKPILQTLLRQELQFDGLIMSDCLSMVGAELGDVFTRAKYALSAGCDMLIVCGQTPAALQQLLTQLSTLPQSPESVARIETFTRQIGEKKPRLATRL